jgi:hypothetical protein
MQSCVTTVDSLLRVLVPSKSKSLQRIHVKTKDHNECLDEQTKNKKQRQSAKRKAPAKNDGRRRRQRQKVEKEEGSYKEA